MISDKVIALFEKAVDAAEGMFLGSGSDDIAARKEIEAALRALGIEVTP